MSAHTQGTDGLFIAALGYFSLTAPLRSAILRSGQEIIACASFAAVAGQMIGSETRLYDMAMRLYVRESKGNQWGQLSAGEQEELFQNIKEDNVRWLPEIPASLAIASKAKISFGLVCKDVAGKMKATLKAVEKTGELFKDYRAIIYESNSHDSTAQIARDWAKQNPKVQAITETVVASHREENIARARNKVLDILLTPAYDEFEYFMFVDCDFPNGWPAESVTSCLLREEWGGCCSNGIAIICDHTIPYGQVFYC